MASEPIRAPYDDALEAKLNRFVDAFEDACDAAPLTDVAEFMPAENDESYRTIAVELLRVDLQRRLESELPARLGEYRQRFPKALGRPSAFAELAFEEYRCRIACGETVKPSEYQKRYGIDTANWPGPSESTLRLGAASTSTIVEQLQRAAQGEPLHARPREAVKSIMAGDEFSGFQLQQQIGTGTFAVVFLAEQPELSHRQTVLKITATSDREAKQLARLQHTNIVPIHSVHQTDDMTAVCMPFFGPCTLRDVVDAVEDQSTTQFPANADLIAHAIDARHEQVGTTITADGPEVLPWSRMSYVNACLSIGEEIAQGLKHAHEQGIVHGDLKPANVLLSDHGPAMLLDFNLSDRAPRIEAGASHEGEVLSPAPAEPRSIVGGTLSYASPEHLQALLTGSHIGPSTDIYSLGLVLYHMLAGTLPFPARPGSSELAIREMISDRELGPPPLRSQNPSVPVAVESIVHKLLAPNPEDRYESARDVAEDLHRQLNHRPLAHAPNTSWRERLQKWNRRHPRLTTTVGATCLIVFAAAGLASTWVAQQRRVATERVLSSLDNLENGLPEVRAYTSIPGASQRSLKYGLNLAQTLSQPLVGVAANDDAAAQALPVDRVHLPLDQRQRAHRLLSEAQFLSAHAQLQLARLAGTEDESNERLADARVQNQRASTLKIPAHRGILSRQVQTIDELRSGVSTEQVLSGGSIHEVDFIHAIEAIREGRIQDGIAHLESLRERQPYDLSLWLLLGNCYAQTGELKTAEGCFTTCCLMWKESPLGYFQRGLCRLDLEAYEEAVADFSKAIGRDQQLIAARINRAVAFRKLGRHEAALQDLDFAIDSQAPQTRIFFMRSESRAAVGDKEGSEQDFLRGLELKPRDSQSFVRRGLALLKTDSNAALADFKSAAKLDPNSYPALRNWAYVVAEKQGRPGDAIGLLNRILEFRPNQASEIVSRGVMHARLNNRIAAIADAERALTLSDRSKTLYQVACIYALCSVHSDRESSDRERAIELLTGAFNKENRWRKIAMRDADLAPLRDDSRFRSLLATTNGVAP